MANLLGIFIASFASIGLSYSADYQIIANIRYAPYAETVLDIVQGRAPALQNRPAVLFFHGGGWVEGKKEEAVDAFCAPWVRMGFVVANVEYRLASVAPAPAAVNDALAAAHWLQDHASDFKIDPNRIVASGFSAGGHLALMAGMTPESAQLGPAARIAAVVNFYGIADVAEQLEGATKRPYAVAWIPEQSGRMDLARRLSPITYCRKGLPPILSIHGDADPVVPYEQSVRLTKELKAAGSFAELITVPHGGHGFDEAEMNKLWPQILKWLKKHKINP